MYSVKVLLDSKASVCCSSDCNQNIRVPTTLTFKAMVDTGVCSGYS